eukprot:TRINITY_DN21316_c0_g1_i1.p1 TRINITY_DN21316_c0_g1~~TRINITY_DN21316_c0_g1_i1.p1  ORF type:complete len:597 (-),score=62.56 TRINITY_DN21316_c0_g1_i1:81-1808(-)
MGEDIKEDGSLGALSYSKCDLQTELSIQLKNIDKKLETLLSRVGEGQYISTPEDTSQTVPKFLSPFANTKRLERKSEEKNPTQDREEKMRKIRNKIRVIGSLAAAGKKRRSLQSGGNVDEVIPNDRDDDKASGNVDAKLAVGDQNPDLASSSAKKDSMRVSSRQESSRISVIHDMVRNFSGKRNDYASDRRPSTCSDSRVDTSSMESTEECRMARIQVIKSRSGIDRASMRNRAWRFTENPLSSNWAYIFCVFVNTFILTSVVLSFFQALPGIDSTTYDISQAVIECCFAMELTIRFVCCPERCAFFVSPFNWIDMMSVVPFAFRITSWIRPEKRSLVTAIIAVVPLVRLLKLVRRFEKLQLLISAFQLALEALPVLIYTGALLAVFFTELIYFVELQYHDADLYTSFWFTIVTMSTVGYGDTTPVAPAGRFVAMMLIIMSALYMAIPIGIVGHAFSTVWSDRDRLLVMHRFREAFAEGGFTTAAIQEIFSIFDEDDSGELDIEEFTVMLKSMQMNMSEERVCLLYQALDKEGLGRITLEALINGLTPKAFARQFFTQNFVRASHMGRISKLSDD